MKIHKLKTLMTEGRIRILFYVSLLLKGAFALLELIAGAIAYVVTQQFVLTIAQRVTREELLEDPRDFVANTLLQLVRDIPTASQHFAALYLFSHGLIKLWLIAGLLRQRLWYYPTALIVFGLFIVYQLYRYTFTHSLFLILITILDLIVMWLTWHEYRYLRYRKEREH